MHGLMHVAVLSRRNGGPALVAYANRNKTTLADVFVCTHTHTKRGYVDTN